MSGTLMTAKSLTAALLAAVITASPAWAAKPLGDAAKGGKLFLQCRACHTVGLNEASGVGPNLYGVFGAKAGQKPDYQYTLGLTGAGLIWTPANLDRWLQKPTALVADTKMAFPGVKSAAARKDIIAYLATLKPAQPHIKP